MEKYNFLNKLPSEPWVQPAIRLSLWAFKPKTAKMFAIFKRLSPYAGTTTGLQVADVKPTQEKTAFDQLIQGNYHYLDKLRLTEIFTMGRSNWPMTLRKYPSK